MNLENEINFQSEEELKDLIEFINNFKNDKFGKEYIFYFNRLKEVLENNYKSIENAYIDLKIDESNTKLSNEDVIKKLNSSSNEKILRDNAQTINQTFEDFEAYINKQIYYNILKTKIYSILEEFQNV